MEYAKINYSVDDGVAIIALDSPKNMNAIDGTLIGELIDAFNVASADNAVHAILLNSTGRAFCGGGDLGVMYEGIKAGRIDFADQMSDAALVMKAMKTSPKPVIGAVNGAAAGAGFLLALGCDYVIADDRASFICAFVNVGLVPDTGGVYVMARALGASKTAELAMTGRPVTAEEAKGLGFVAEVVAPEDLAEKSMKVAKRFAKGPALAYAKTKELIYRSQFSDFGSYIPSEVEAQVACMDTQDFRNRVISFVEKK